MADEFGIVYVATGKDFIDEAIRSACSVKERMPDIPTAIFLDDQAHLKNNPFNHITVIPEPTYTSFDRIATLAQTPFNKTLFLDTDTLVIQTLYELPLLLDRFDLAYSHAPFRYGQDDFPGCNEAFPQGNAGVILFKRNAAVLNTFKAWAKLYAKDKLRIHKEDNTRRVLDQPSFRQALFESSLNLAVLTPEYNLRTPYPYFVGNAMVKILHGREPDLSRAMSRINQSISPRVGNAPGLLEKIKGKIRCLILYCKTCRTARVPHRQSLR
ncbi:MAG: hypothetical protein KAS94_11210 [Desulfobulbaceae bacterium]|nr:hypothetical protein [Desulfobulbaceae bacterium]